MRYYEYRLGNGNDGCYPRAIIELEDNENPYAAIKAFVVNRYIVGSKTRKYISKNIEIDGEKEYTIYATVYEGPKGETEIGAAWLCAEMRHIPEDDMDDYAEYERWTLSETLDRGAMMIYKREAKINADAIN